LTMTETKKQAMRQPSRSCFEVGRAAQRLHKVLAGAITSGLN
jgi:hypothetical protein